MQTYKKILFILIAFISVSVSAKDGDTVLSFETEQEYVDFIYSLSPVLLQQYPKSIVRWVYLNSSQYETDLSNVLLLANADFNKKVNKKFFKLSQGESITSLLDKGTILLGKRKSVSGDQAIWINIIGYDQHGKVLVVNDSKVGAAQQIPSDGLESAYYIK
ncbi:hypothetical protein [Leptospira wolffii]|uniref:hypothetical protein n=1 Tax=Leptospira wolffii TaxID=409998 RepID=UPI0002FF154F|nr:hypothetical protein [Leptospira wolffii]EPG64179.1 hypothetical protein LEP1GSC061_3528 [Leptospira wolffii serovar Khorat str. Khorat-H2]